MATDLATPHVPSSTPRHARDFVMPNAYSFAPPTCRHRPLSHRLTLPLVTETQVREHLCPVPIPIPAGAAVRDRGSHGGETLAPRIPIDVLDTVHTIQEQKWVPSRS